MEYQLSAQLRTIKGKQVKQLRQQGFIPAVIYGKNVSPQILQVAMGDFVKLYHQAGQSTLVNLSIDEQKLVKVLITEVAHDPTTDAFTHVDFYQVDMSEKVKAKIPIHFVGESKAVKELGGVLTKTLQEMEVECLPEYLPHEIVVDLSALGAFGDMIRVADVVLPEHVRPLEKEDTVIATVEAMKEEKVEEVVSKEAEQAAIAGLKTEKAVKEEERTKEVEEIQEQPKG